MPYLLDANVLSEVRKGDRAIPSVIRWFDSVPTEQLFVSVMSVGELQRGLELLRRNDPHAVFRLETWLDQLVAAYLIRTLPITSEIASLWGRLCLTQPLPIVDGLMAATALVHDLTMVTRNTRDFERSGARLLNPFL